MRLLLRQLYSTDPEENSDTTKHFNTVDSHYNDTFGIREKYRYIQTINKYKLNLFCNGWDIERVS